MTGNAKKTFGTKIFVVAAGGDIETGAVAKVINVGKPKITRGMQDATSHDSAGGWEEVIPDGTAKVEPFTIQVEYIANDAFDQAMIAACAPDGGLQDVEIHEYGAAGYIKTPLSAYVSDYGPDDAPVKGKQTASFTLTPTGPMDAKGAVT